MHLNDLPGRGQAENWTLAEKRVDDGFLIRESEFIRFEQANLKAERKPAAQKRNPARPR